LFSDLDAL